MGAVSYSDRNDYRWAVIDAQTSRLRAARQAALEAGAVDPECRYAQRDISHACRGVPCAAEADARWDYEHARRAAEVIPTPEPAPRRVLHSPVYRVIQP